ncbi:hypothetical protein GCG54_00008312 [Colletotrichum gloeosporioides]|uniref:Clr5 domain-containing protein n=1 Tax=Colletotrichum gloeosporioides TaxID=474922 RepID=A0A8H4C838_COLGL|nr:uncharacterized protein GCG54_00008312 [Colletotrichum gloeosporioides]KAF3798854.1 hypothetical protein GCG54_00008312 [Colletotrichum gloeosporioides]
MESLSSVMLHGAQRSERPRSGQHWDAKKDTLQRLYLKENKPLREIVVIMNQQHLFMATERMYKRQFMKWRWRKYNSKGLRQSQLNGDRVEMVEGEMTCQRTRRRRLSPDLSRTSTGSQKTDPFPMTSTSLLYGTEKDRLSYGLLLNLHDLIQGACRQDPEWHRRA